MTSIVPAGLGAKIDQFFGALPPPGASAMPVAAAGERDSAVTALADTLPMLSRLAGLASAQSSGPVTAAMPVATPPTPQQQTQAQQSAAQPAFAGDYYTDGDDAAAI